MAFKPNREQAWEILTEYTQSEALLKHALAVEGVMRHFAELFGEDPEEWGAVGLLHDLDYQQYPEEHCHKTGEILAARDVIRKGCERLGMELDEVIQETIKGMQKCAEAIGLAGDLQ